MLWLLNSVLQVIRKISAKKQARRSSLKVGLCFSASHRPAWYGMRFRHVCLSCNGAGAACLVYGACSSCMVLCDILTKGQAAPQSVYEHTCLSAMQMPVMPGDHIPIHHLPIPLVPYSYLSYFCTAVLQTFVKTVNYQHIMPTRYTLDVDLKSVVTGEALDNATKKVEARKVRTQDSLQPKIAYRCLLLWQANAWRVMHVCKQPLVHMLFAVMHEH